MMRNSFGHLDDEELARLADGVITSSELRDLDAHVSTCVECQNAVTEALRGLSVLARASQPPTDMEQHVRARRWSIAHDRSARISGGEEDIAEVGGRGADEESEPETPPDLKKGPDPEA